MNAIELLSVMDWSNGLGTSGLLDWASEKISSTTGVLQAFSTLAAIGFVIIRAIKTQLAVGAIVIASLVAGGLVWVVFNVASLKDRVGNEANAIIMFDEGSRDHLSSGDLSRFQ